MFIIFVKLSEIFLSIKNKMHQLYYNRIHHNKNYKVDIEYLKAALSKSGISFGSIIEVGCGTGEHTFLLSRSFENVYAFENDEIMMQQAVKKCESIKGITFFSTRIQNSGDFKIENIESACAFFNVVNYILDFEDLRSFFYSIYCKLKLGALFAFDSLNKESFVSGDAEDTKIYNQDITFARHIHSVCSEDRSFLSIQDKIADFSNSKIVSYSTKYRLWDIEDMRDAMKGFFEIVHCKKKEQLVEGVSTTNQLQFLLKKI